MPDLLEIVLTENEIRKNQGIHYTPSQLASFVASKIISEGLVRPTAGVVTACDPAVGDGELLLALAKALAGLGCRNIELNGFDTDAVAVDIARDRLRSHANEVNIACQDFLEHVVKYYGVQDDMFCMGNSESKYDLVISNPPYVRTQVLGAERAQKIANDFDLKGRVDLYYPFICGIARILKPGGIAGIIVSNRFMTTRSGASVRKRILQDFDVIHIWDLGDTKFFEAAVLPVVLIVRKKSAEKNEVKPKFSSIYSIETDGEVQVCLDMVEGLEMSGYIHVGGEQSYFVKHGELEQAVSTGQDEGVWRIKDSNTSGFLSTIEQHTFCSFGDIGKIRVGVKSTADEVFISDNWREIAKDGFPELLKPLTTHYIARRFCPVESSKGYEILYTHEIRDGRRQVVKVEEYPNAYKYLLKYKERLEGRKYVIEAGRKWFELWVPQDPDLWQRNKIVFRDISEKPTFWMDLKGSIVNGDCYWFTNEKRNDDGLLWLAMAVANSSFIEFYYDQMFNNKLYANRRRFMTQYVEKFPVPQPTTAIAKKIIALSKRTYDELDGSNRSSSEEELDSLVWKAFGLDREKVLG